jgi:hypothetical protein
MGLDLSGGHSAMDYAEHSRTYKGFVKGTITLIAIVALILVARIVERYQLFALTKPRRRFSRSLELQTKRIVAGPNA